MAAGKTPPLFVTSGMTGNRGDQAIRLGCRKLLAEAGLETAGEEMSPFIRPRDFVRLSAHLVRGGGVLYSVGHPVQDVTSKAYTPAVLAAPALARVFRRRCAVVCCGASRLSSRAVAAFARGALRGAAILSARDEHSAENLMNLTGRDDVTVVADPALALTPTDVQPGLLGEPSEPYVCVAPRRWHVYCGSAVPLLGRRTGTGHGETHDSYLREMTAFIHGMVERFSLRVVLVSMVQSPLNRPGQDDHSFSLEIRRGLPLAVQHHVEIAPPDLSLERLMALIYHANAVVAVRLHASLISAAMGTPTVNFHYSEKGRNLLSALGLVHGLLSLDDFRAADALDLFAKACTSREAFGSQVGSALEAARARLRAHFHLISRVL